jgi:predicted TPR repeat methyltransferase
LSKAISKVASTPIIFDLIFAADVLIYIGDPQALFKAASKALVEGGRQPISSCADRRGSPIPSAMSTGWRERIY